MPEKIIATDVNDASRQFYEILSDVEVAGDETFITLGEAVDILVENPRVSTNTFICHDACDVLINAMAIMCNRSQSRYLQTMLGRPTRLIHSSAMLPEDINAGLNDAGPFKIGYTTAIRDGVPWLDAYVLYGETEAYELLVEDFAAISFCLQYLSHQRKLPVGQLRFHVFRPQLLLTSQVHGDWDAAGWSIGCDHLDLATLLTQNFRQDLQLLLDEEMPVGIGSSFLRRIVIPAISILQSLRNGQIDEAYSLARQLPPNLDWSLAVKHLFRVKGN